MPIICAPCVYHKIIHFFQLQEAFARGDLKPGLNIEVDGTKRKAVNNIVSIALSRVEIHKKID